MRLVGAVVACGPRFVSPTRGPTRRSTGRGGTGLELGVQRWRHAGYLYR